MWIHAPCRLGEQFTHNKSWAPSGPLYLVGLNLFVWHCNIDGVTLCGSRQPYAGIWVDYFNRSCLDQVTISFEVPDRLLSNDRGVPLRELGIEAKGVGWVSALLLDRDGNWRYRVTRGQDRRALEVRTEALDKRFEPILPAVRMQLYDFL